MTRLTTRDTQGAIKLQQPFTTSGALRGDIIQQPDYLPSLGYLPEPYRAAFRAAAKAGPVYVVRSYATPIAWHSPATGWTIPNVKYSATTSKHQGTVRRDLA